MDTRLDHVLRRMATRWIRFMQRGPKRVGLVLVLHGVDVDGGRPEAVRSIVPRMSASLLDSHLGYLAEHFDFVAASHIRDAVLHREPGARFPIAVTFDDDLASHTAIAGPLLERHGVRGTFFLSGGHAEPAHRWWDYLEVGIDRAPFGDRCLDAVLSASDPAARFRQLRTAERAALLDCLRERVPGDSLPALLDEGGVRALASAGHEIGHHTLRHEPLVNLDEAQLRDALTAGRQALEALSQAPVRIIAYPHGEADRRVVAAARAANFDVGFTTAHAAVTAYDDPLLVPRLAPSPVSTAYLALELARRTTASRAGV